MQRRLAQDEQQAEQDQVDHSTNYRTRAGEAATHFAERSQFIRHGFRRPRPPISDTLPKPLEKEGIKEEDDENIYRNN